MIAHVMPHEAATDENAFHCRRGPRSSHDASWIQLATVVGTAQSGWVSVLHASASRVRRARRPTGRTELTEYCQAIAVS